MSALWAVDLAGRFWSAVGGAPGFPRDLFDMLERVGVNHFDLPALHVGSAQAFLDAWNFPRLPVDEGPGFALHACLVAWNRHGVMLIERDDPPDERRFSVAHELAHFLHDYWAPRDEVERRMGRRALPAFEGERDAAPAERLRALLAVAPLRVSVHLMARGAYGEVRDRVVSVAERRADELACELLAPADAVLAEAGDGPATVRREDLARALERRFGFPPAPARAYAARLVPAPPAPSGLLRHLKDNLQDRTERP